MKIELSTFNEYVLQFVKGALLPAVNNRWTKFKIGMAIGSGTVALTAGTPAWDGLKALGVLVEEGHGDSRPVAAVDVDMLKRCVDGGIDAAGDLRIDALGIDVERADLDRFIKLLETGTLS